MERRQADYNILERQALVLLAAETAIDPQHEKLIVHISAKPAFDNYIFWLVCADNEQTEFTAKRLLWDRQFDKRRFFDPMAGLKYGWSIAPTIIEKIATLPAADVRNLLAEARSIPVPELTPSKSIVLDGTRWSVSVAQAFGNQPRTWNVEPPEWRSLTEWTVRFVRFLDGQLASNS